MSKMFAFGAGFFWLYSGYHYGTGAMDWLVPLVVVTVAYFAGRGVRWRFGSVVASAAATAMAAARATSVASSKSQSAAVAQGGSVTLNLYQPTEVDRAMGYDRSTFLEGLHGNASHTALQAHGIDVSDGVPYLIDDAPEDVPVLRDPAR